MLSAFWAGSTGIIIEDRREIYSLGVTVFCMMCYISDHLLFYMSFPFSLSSISFLSVSSFSALDVSSEQQRVIFISSSTVANFHRRHSALLIWWDGLPGGLTSGIKNTMKLASIHLFRIYVNYKLSVILAR